MNEALLCKTLSALAGMPELKQGACATIEQMHARVVRASVCMQLCNNHATRPHDYESS